MRRMLALALPALVVSTMMVGTTNAAEKVKSGLPVGEFASPFDVQDITGPNQGTTLCYR